MNKPNQSECMELICKNELGKNNPSLNAYQDWTAYLEEAAEILINEDRVMDAAIYLKECWKWAVKRGDGVCLTDGGAYNLMITLMEYLSLIHI